MPFEKDFWGPGKLRAVIAIQAKSTRTQYLQFSGEMFDQNPLRKTIALNGVFFVLL